MEQKAIPILLVDNFFLFPNCNKIITLENNKNLKKIIVSAWKKSEGKFLIISSRKLLESYDLKNGYNKEIFFDYGSLVKIEIDFSMDANIEVVFNSLRDIKLIGLERIKLIDFFNDKEDDIWKGTYQIFRENFNLYTPQEVKKINELSEKFVHFLPNILKKNNINITDSIHYLGVGDLSNFFDYIVQSSKNFDRDFKQMMIEEFKLERRLKIILELEKKTRKIQQNINVKINEKVIEQQKAIYLREQLESIQDQLDKIDGVESDKDIYLKKLEEEDFPEHIKKIIQKEIKICNKMHSQSSEANMIRSYIDLLINLPWSKQTKEKSDLIFARQELDKEHFGLEKVKDRIIEHLALIQRTENNLGNVICFVGPPGVGKTSLASSIAKATGRNFVKMSVGGISDESEIRGHRRTYIGSLPGKIIQGMKKAQVLNPLFLIDEIDKIGSGGFHGDISNALLEVLDPSQNNKFVDNYLGEISYDLSKVLFICTANSTDIPQALFDRMEIIYLSSYTEIEKLNIAKNYLVPKNIENYKFSTDQINFTDESLIEIIRSFTQEAGVREINRMIQKIIRKFAVEISQKKSDKLEINVDNISRYLGKKKYDSTKKQSSPQIGVSTGLAYTYFGGDILSIEVGYFQGKGDLILTGNLGDVMKESAKISLNYVKSNHEKFGINKELFLTNDIHVHVPEGATPKDGPSAGIAITSAIISAFSGKKIVSEIGMTGEITLRGRVLPIGGLREKSIAAHKNYLTEIIIPKENERDLEDIPKEVLDFIKINFVENYEEVWRLLF